MKSKIRLYFSPASKQYYTEDHNLDCSHCGSKVEELMIYASAFGKNGIKEHLICRCCWNESKKVTSFGRVQEFKIIILTDCIPVDGIPVLFRLPTLAERKGEDVFSVAKKQIGQEKTIDKAWRSKQIDFMHDPDYQAFDINKSLKQLSNDSEVMTKEQFMKKLLDIGSSELLIEGNEVKRLQ